MRAASAGSRTRTSTAKTTPRMPDASGIRPAPLGRTPKVFLAATLLVVVVLGVTFGLTSLQAHRTADESIRRALVGRRRGVQAFLAGRTAAFAGMSGVSLQVPQFRERLLKRSRGDVLDQAEEYRHLLGASWVLVTTDRGLLVARTDYPEEFDIDLSRGALIAQALSGEQAGPRRRYRRLAPAGGGLGGRGSVRAGGWGTPDRSRGTDPLGRRQRVRRLRLVSVAGRRARGIPGAAAHHCGCGRARHRAGAGNRLRAGAADRGSGAPARPGDAPHTGRRLQRRHRRDVGRRDRRAVASVQEPRGGPEGEGGAGGVHDGGLPRRAHPPDRGHVGPRRAAAQQRVRQPLRREGSPGHGRHGRRVPRVRPRAAGAGGDQDAAPGDPRGRQRRAGSLQAGDPPRAQDLPPQRGPHLRPGRGERDVLPHHGVRRGTSLNQLISSRGRLPIPVTLTVGKQLCRALEVAHEQGIIHRDIKPQNIVVEPSGFLKVMDFGIARLASAPQGKGLTQEGASIGTPDYMSPEQLLGMELDARSDLYAAGVVLFECVTGRVPFDGESVYAVVAKHLEAPAPDPRKFNAEVPEALSQVILKAMAEEREDRYQTAAER